MRPDDRAGSLPAVRGILGYSAARMSAEAQDLSDDALRQEIASVEHHLYERESATPTDVELELLRRLRQLQAELIKRLEPS